MHLVLAGSYQIGMVILLNLDKFGHDAFGSSRLVLKWHTPLPQSDALTNLALSNFDWIGLILFTYLSID